MSQANIAPQLQHMAVPVGLLQLHPRNPRDHDLGAIISSLAAFGQLKPIVAQRRGDGPHTIVAGHGQYLAMAEHLHWPEVAAVVADMDDRTALRFLVADNRTQELGSTDQDKLADILAELAMAGALDATGFDAEDVDDLLRLVEHPPDMAALAAKYGDGEGQLDEQFWPRLSLRVQSDVYSRWNALWGELEGTDTQRLARIIELAYDAPDMAAKTPR